MLRVFLVTIIALAGLAAETVSAVGPFIKLGDFQNFSNEKETFFVRQSAIQSGGVEKERDRFILSLTTTEIDQTVDGGHKNRVYVFYFRSGSEAKKQLNEIFSCIEDD